MLSGSATKGGARRARGQERRSIVVPVRVGPTEKVTIEAAAARNGLALSAYIAETVLDAAEHRAAPIAAVQREILFALMFAAGQVCRIGVNLNQAVARLNTTGQPGPDLEPMVAYCERVIRRVDEAAELVRRRMS
jgi:hypothetical protein